MGIGFDEKNRLFFIETAHSSMCLAIVDDEGFLCNVYYGNPVGEDDLTYLLRTKIYPFLPSHNSRDRGGFLDMARMEFPSSGVGDYRKSAVCLRDKEGHDASQFTYVSHRIFDGKEKLYGLASDGKKIRIPATFGEGAQTLEIELEEKVLGVRAYLSYSIFGDSDAIIKSVRLENRSDSAVIIDRLLSSCLDLDGGTFENNEPDIITLSGSWARERRLDRRSITRGNTEVYSTRGVTSHQFQPFSAVCEKNTDDSKGRIYAQNLIWSGNFVCGSGIDQFETVRSYIGINPEHYMELKCRRKLSGTRGGPCIYRGRIRFHDPYLPRPVQGSSDKEPLSP